MRPSSDTPGHPVRTKFAKTSRPPVQEGEHYFEKVKALVRPTASLCRSKKRRQRVYGEEGMRPVRSLNDTVSFRAKQEASCLAVYGGEIRAVGEMKRTRCAYMVIDDSMCHRCLACQAPARILRRNDHRTRMKESDDTVHLRCLSSSCRESSLAMHWRDLLDRGALSNTELEHTMPLSNSGRRFRLPYVVEDQHERRREQKCDATRPPG